MSKYTNELLVLKLCWLDLFYEALWMVEYCNLADFEGQVWQLIDSCWQLMKFFWQFGWTVLCMNCSGLEYHVCLSVDIVHFSQESLKNGRGKMTGLFIFIYYLFRQWLCSQPDLAWLSLAGSGFGNKWVQSQTQINLVHFWDKMNHSITELDMENPQTQFCDSTILTPFYIIIAQLRPQLKPAQKQNQQ